MNKIFFLVLLFLTACTTYQPEPTNLTSTAEINNVNGYSTYQQNCAACHGNDGTGALAGVPDLTKIAGFKGNSAEHTELSLHFEHVKNGLKRPGDPMAMPAKGGNPNLTDQDIREVLKYMHEKFSNK